MDDAADPTLSSMSDDVLERIVSYLPLSSIPCMLLVCRRFRDFEPLLQSFALFPPIRLECDQMELRGRAKPIAEAHFEFSPLSFYEAVLVRPDVIESLHKELKFNELIVTDWMLQAGGDCLARLLTFRVPVKNPLGPNTTRVSQTQRVRFASPNRLLVHAQSVAEDVPYGSSFTVHTLWELSLRDAGGCGLAVRASCDFPKGEVWMKDLVSRMAMQGCKDYFSRLIDVVNRIDRSSSTINGASSDAHPHILPIHDGMGQSHSPHEIREVCPLGTQCTQSDPTHFVKYSHTPISQSAIACDDGDDSSASDGSSHPPPHDTMREDGVDVCEGYSGISEEEQKRLVAHVASDGDTPRHHGAQDGTSDVPQDEWTLLCATDDEPDSVVVTRVDGPSANAQWVEARTPRGGFGASSESTHSLEISPRRRGGSCSTSKSTIASSEEDESSKSDANQHTHLEKSPLKATTTSSSDMASPLDDDDDDDDDDDAKTVLDGTPSPLEIPLVLPKRALHGEDPSTAKMMRDDDGGDGDGHDKQVSAPLNARQAEEELDDGGKHKLSARARGAEPIVEEETRAGLAIALFSAIMDMYMRFVRGHTLSIMLLVVVLLLLPWGAMLHRRTSALEVALSHPAAHRLQVNGSALETRVGFLEERAANVLSHLAHPQSSTASNDDGRERGELGHRAQWREQMDALEGLLDQARKNLRAISRLAGTTPPLSATLEKRSGMGMDEVLERVRQQAQNKQDGAPITLGRVLKLACVWVVVGVLVGVMALSVAMEVGVA